MDASPPKKEKMTIVIASGKGKKQGKWGGACSTRGRQSVSWDEVQGRRFVDINPNFFEAGIKREAAEPRKVLVMVGEVNKTKWTAQWGVSKQRLAFPWWFG